MIGLDSHPASGRPGVGSKQGLQLAGGDLGSLLAELRRRMPLAGITRVSEISWLSPAGIHVFQATRPLLHSHVFFGQNCGSQGKGLDAETAEVSAIMEAIEDFCAEPRNPWLVRGSYDALCLRHPIVAPRRFATCAHTELSDSEPLMWTFARSLGSGDAVLVPAELVYFPFFPRDYQTQSRFLSNSTGLAAARTLVEASVHALYEIVERHLRAGLEYAEPRVHAERIQTDSLLELQIFNRIRELHPEFTVAVLSVSPVVNGEVNRGISMMVCLLIDESGCFFPGYGCRRTARAALTQAAIEALQCAVTTWSGSREDGTIRELSLQELEKTHEVPKPQLTLQDLPPETLTLTQLAERTPLGKPLTTPREELGSLQDYCAGLGLGEIFVKDITVVGLDVPAVRILVPGAAHPGSRLSRPNKHGHADLKLCQYSLDL